MADHPGVITSTQITYTPGTKPRDRYLMRVAAFYVDDGTGLVRVELDDTCWNHRGGIDFVIYWRRKALAERLLLGPDDALTDLLLGTNRGEREFVANVREWILREGQRVTVWGQASLCDDAKADVQLVKPAEHPLAILPDK